MARNKQVFDTLISKLKELDDKALKIGWFKTAKYESGTPVAYVAAIQEFGSAKNSIPPRPFMRPTYIAKKKDWLDVAARGARAMLRGSETAESVLDKIGFQAEGDIAKTISEVTAPPLSNITLQLRRWRMDGRVITGKTVGEAAREVAKPGWKKPNVSDKPLVDTGVLLATLTHVVEDDKTP